MNKIYPILILTLHIISFSSLEAFLTPSTRVITKIIQNRAVRNFSSPSKSQAVLNFLKRSKTFETLETLSKNQADQKMVGTIFLQRLALNTAATVGITQTLNTGFAISTTLYGAALASAIRGSLREYGQFLQHGIIKRDLGILKKTVEENFNIIKGDLSKTHESILNTREILGQQIAQAERQLGEQVATTTKAITQTEENLHRRVQGTESILSGQIGKVQDTLDSRIGVTQEALDGNIGQIAKKLTITNEQLQALLKGQAALSQNQKLLLNAMLTNTLQTQQSELLKKLHFNSSPLKL